MHGYRPVTVAGVPPFFGGALGYVSYDAVEQFHEIANDKKEPLGMPEIFFVFVQTLVAFDNLKHTIKVIDNVQLNERTDLRRAYDAAVKRIHKVISSLQKKPRGIEPRDLTQNKGDRKFRSNLTERGFVDAVEKAKEYIKAGDIIQVVLCQRLETETKTDPFEIYRALRFINPSPYMFYLELEDLRVIGSSPETMVRLTGDTIELRPIAGTRRRGATPEEERELEADLLADPKERAEHIMLVDLGRNDVGRVAAIGSVEVNELMAIERYSHVIHIVSNVRGKLAAGQNAIRSFRVGFSRRHRFRRAEDPRHADHRRAGAAKARPLRRRHRLLRLQRQSGHLHRHSHHRHERQKSFHQCRRGHRRRLGSQDGIPGDAQQSARHAESGRARRTVEETMILLIDNYDSFTYNLYHYLGELGADVKVFRNNKITLDEIEALRPEKIVISPGPCTPKEAGISCAAITRFGARIPILGVCLGHQAIGAAYGGAIVRAPSIMHGKLSDVSHDSQTIFRQVKNPFAAMRYHSLVIDPKSLPTELMVSARADGDIIMAVRHKNYPVEGVQFHPESILNRRRQKAAQKLLGPLLKRMR